MNKFFHSRRQMILPDSKRVKLGYFTYPKSHREREKKNMEKKPKAHKLKKL